MYKYNIRIYLKIFAQHTKIKVIKNLKPIPAIVNQIVAAIDDPNCSAKNIADIIKFHHGETCCFFCIDCDRMEFQH